MKKFKKTEENLSGLRTAALYGLMPNRLGFCGSQKNQEQKMLHHFLEGKVTSNKIRLVLEKFEAAYAYYRLIAAKNKIKDPFDERVVGAYWIGNELLENISGDDLKKMIIKDFTRPGLLTNADAKKRLANIPKNSKPHHSFHVFILGAITGRVDLSDIKLKDICRVGWGRLSKIKKRSGKLKIVVRYQPIVLKGRKVRLGSFIEKEINWDKKIIKDVKIGDWVSFHWGMLAQAIDRKEVFNLKKYTQNTIKEL
jgi:hypothetical protein